MGEIKEINRYSSELTRGGLSVRTIVKAEDVSILKQVGDRMGVGIVTLAKEGQRYTSTYGLNSTVGKSEAYVELGGGENQDLGDFWKEVTRLRSEISSEIAGSPKKKGLFSGLRRR